MRNNHHRMRPAILFLVMANCAQAASITVNTATDDFGSVGSNCSLREAIESANNNADFGGCTHTGIYGAAITDVVILPAITVTLTRIGTDDSNNSGDLDIDGPLRIDGVDDTTSVIRGDTSDADSDRHRLVHVISGSVTLNDLTLRDGLEDGSAAGGGLRSEPGSTTTLNRVTVTANVAGGNAGGILNRGTMTLNDALVSLNETVDADTGGGGIFNSPGATLTLIDSRVLNNTVNSSANNSAEGGGIYSDAGAVLTLDNSSVDGNVADGRRLVLDDDGYGGGIRVLGTFTMVQSSVTNNEAVGHSGHGGGLSIGNVCDSAYIAFSVIAFNQARDTIASKDGSGEGGGIYNGCLDLQIEDSVISSNQAISGRSASGGGLNGPGTIRRSTFFNNSASGVNSARGGAIHGGTVLRVINSTVVGNHADGNGGGISYLNGTANIAAVFSSTIAANTSGGVGGGMFRASGDMDVANTVLAGNSASGGGNDCSGTFNSFGYNLVQSATGCGMAPNTGDQFNANAGLAALANNGGPTAGSTLGIISAMQTRSPLPDSALLDAGNPGECREILGVVLESDQLGRDRAIDGPDADTTAECDIGAVEYSDALFGNSFE